MLTTTASVNAPKKSSNRQWDSSIVAAVPPCVLIPTYFRHLTSGTKANVQVSYALQTLPIQRPVYATLRCATDWYFFPWRVISPALRETLRMISPSNITLPHVNVSLPPYWSSARNGKLKARNSLGASGLDAGWYVYSSESLANWCCQPGSLASYLGMPAGHPGDSKISVTSGATTINLTPSPSRFDTVAYAAYLFIGYHFYINAQCRTLPYMHCSSTDMTTTEKTQILLSSLVTRLEKLSLGSTDDFSSFAPFNVIMGRNAGFLLAPMARVPQNRVVSTDNVSSVRGAGSIKISNDTLYVADIITAVAARNFAARYSYEAGSVLDWLSNEYGVKPKASGNVPTFLGRDSFYVNFSAVVATSSEGLGDLGGRGTGGSNTKSRTLFTEEPGTLMAITSITPQLRIPFASSRMCDLRSIASLPSVDMDNLPYRMETLSEYFNSMLSVKIQGSDEIIDVLSGTHTINGGLTVYNQSDLNSYAVGYVPHFNHFDMEYDRAYGDIVSSLSNWTFSTPYAADVFHRNRAQTLPVNASPVSNAISVNDIFYHDPCTVNAVFDDTALKSQNFIFQMNVNINARVPYGYTVFPQI